MVPSVFMKLVNIYCSNFYGSSLWNLYSKDVDRIFKSWNITVRNVFQVPSKTHRYLIESISDFLHPKVMLTSRYVKFVGSLSSSLKSSIRFLVQFVKDDSRTLTGKTLSRISADTNIEKGSLTVSSVKKYMVYFPVPADQQWRCDLLVELLHEREGILEIKKLFL